MRSELKRALFIAIMGALLLASRHGGAPVSAQATVPDALTFFKNYFITGDYVVAGVGLRGQGVNGLATGSIQISGVPPDAEILAAFLYWQVVSKDALGPDAGNLPVTFKGRPLSSADGPFGKQLGAGTAPCWSSGGGTGSSGGTNKTYSYRADALRLFDIDEETGKFLVNGSHEIQLPDANGVSALGASAVVIYRDPSKPLSAIVMYDGGYTMDQSNQSIVQRIQGFYEPAAQPMANASLTYIMGSGQANKSERLLFEGTLLEINPFRALTGESWDNRTFSVPTSSQTTREVTTSVDHEGFSTFDCLTLTSVIYRTEVQDTDSDGLLDLWESSPTPLSDPRGQPLPLLSAMGANPSVKDVYIEVGYMQTAADTSYGGVVKPAHSHLPPHEALKLVGDMFKNAPEPIAMHFDMGPDYPAGDLLDPSKNAEEYIIRGQGLARGGEAIPEQATVCAPGALDPPWVCQYSAFPGTVGWKTGYRFLRDEVLSVTPPPGVDAPPPGEEFCDVPGYTCNRRFDRTRKDIFRYALFAHAIGLPKSEEPCLDESDTPVPVNSTTGLCSAPLSDNPDFHTPRTNTGVGDFPGADIMVTLGAFPDHAGKPVGTPFMQASTLAHEFGHNAGRRHGGDAFEPNCKPTYLSVMNYLYQLRGLLTNGGTPRLDFSGQVHPLVNETSLTDGSLGSLPYRIGWYAPLAGSYLEDFGTAAARHCDGTPLLSTDVPMVRIDNPTAATPIDWNANGVVDGPPAFALDVNFSGSTTKLDGSPNLLAGSNDWGAILLNQIGARRNTGALFVDTNGRLEVGPLSIDSGRGDLGRGDLGRGDLGRGDLGRGDLGRGDLGRGDLGRGDLGRGDLGNPALGRGDLGRGDLGGGDLFVNDPDNPGGELDFETATDLAKTPPNEFRACVIGVDCPEDAGATPFHSVRLDWNAPNIGGVLSYTAYRVPGPVLLPNQQWTPVGTETSVLGQSGYFVVDDDQLVNGAQYTYFAVAVYAGGIQSDPSNLVTITAVNDPPAAGADSYSTAEDTPLVEAAPGVLVNDADPDTESTLAAALVTGPSHGTLVLNADGSFTYTPQANYNGPDSFTYKATDGVLDSNVATVDITVTAVNDAPAAASDNYSTAEDTVLSVAGAGVLSNDTDLESSLTAVLVSGPAHGTLTLDAAGSFTYTPAPNYNGPDSFTYRAHDGEAATDPATVAITVIAVNDVPVAAADSYSVLQGNVLSVTAPGVLGNDADVEGPLAAVLQAGPTNGTLVLNATGSFTYTPLATFFGTDSFTYAASDGAASTSATVTITVRELRYGFVGVQNLPTPPTKQFNIGSAVPLRWQFTVDGVVYNSVGANPQIAIVSPAGIVIYQGSPQDPGSSSFQPPTAANGFTWQFNWQTKGLPAGTYQVYVGSLQTGQTYATGQAFGPFPVKLK